MDFSKTIAYNKNISFLGYKLYALLEVWKKPDGYCVADNKQLADFLRCSVRAVQKQLANLEREGYIRKEHVEYPTRNERRLWIAR